MDKFLNLQPIGVPGELYIGGKCLSDGYLNNSIQTEKAFIQNPFTEGERIYKTGDLVKLNNNHEITYLGRVDDQVKVNGYRIELGDITENLNETPSVKEAAVILKNQEIVAFIERQTPRILINDEKYSVCSASNYSEAFYEIENLHKDTWPDFFKGSQVIKDYWSKLYVEFPEYQFCLVNQKDEVVAAINTIPIKWSGNKDDVPSGWDDGLKKAFSTDNKNTLFILAGAIKASEKGKKLSYEILKLAKNISFVLGFSHVLAPVRPVFKKDFKDKSLEEYAKLKTANNFPFDPWLKVHEKIGGKIVSYCNESQFVEGTLEQWKLWTGNTFKKSGLYNVNDAMQKIEINIEENTGKYFDQAIMYSHSVENSLNFFNEDIIKNELSKKLPFYMLPKIYIYLDKLPRLSTGKLDYNSLRKIETVNDRSKINAVKAETDIEKYLVDIWVEVLKRKNIGTNHSFFELGGDSIKAISVISKINQKYNIELKAKSLFIKQTIALLAEEIDSNMLISQMDSSEELFDGDEITI